jgi:hypothetical protein
LKIENCKLKIIQEILWPQKRLSPKPKERRSLKAGLSEGVLNAAENMAL